MRSPCLGLPVWRNRLGTEDPPESDLGTGRMLGSHSGPRLCRLGATGNFGFRVSSKRGTISTLRARSILGAKLFYLLQRRVWISSHSVDDLE